MGEGGTGDARTDKRACAAGCLIDSECYKAGATRPSDWCSICEPAFSTTHWAPRPGCVITLAGSGDKGFLDGPASKARFNRPDGIAVDTDGTVYVADTDNHVVRMIFRGQVSTFAGTVPKQGPPTSGDRPGPLKQAKFNAPIGIVTGKTGTRYLADSENYKIHILSGGFVVKHAGGSYGEADGAALQAGFRAPTRLALDSGGNIYVTDTSNHLLRKVYTDSLSIRRVTTLAGTRPGSGSPAGGYANGKGTESKFHTPYGVAVDGKGTVYVADRDNHLIRKVSADGTVTTFAGLVKKGVPQSGSADGAALTKAQFNSPEGLAMDSSGKLYVAEADGNRIRVVHKDQVYTLAGTGVWGKTNGQLLDAEFGGPTDLALDGKGKLYIVDHGNHVIRVLALKQ